MIFNRWWAIWALGHEPTLVSRRVLIFPGNGEQPLAFVLASRPLRSLFEIQI
jgi:hypothetical protein